MLFVYIGWRIKLSFSGGMYLYQESMEWNWKKTIAEKYVGRWINGKMFKGMALKGGVKELQISTSHCVVEYMEC